MSYAIGINPVGRTLPGGMSVSKAAAYSEDDDFDATVLPRTGMFGESKETDSAFGVVVLGKHFDKNGEVAHSDPRSLAHTASQGQDVYTKDGGSLVPVSKPAPVAAPAPRPGARPWRRA